MSSAMPGGATAPAVARSTTTLPTKTGLSSGTLHGRNPWIRRATWAIVLVGAALRLWQYAAGTSLWWDELAVAQNIIGRPMWTLLTAPMAWDQVAPKGFLLAEKLATSVLGNNEHGLWLFPLIFSIVGLVLFARIAERVLGVGAPIAVLLFATAGPLIDYAARAKQYSTDVAVAVLLI